jgi:hypothetical protein
VRAWVLPPAPYVTDTKLGRNVSSRRTQFHNCASSASVRGGKNSNESFGGGWPASRIGTPRIRVCGAAAGGGLSEASTGRGAVNNRFTFNDMTKHGRTTDYISLGQGERDRLLCYYPYAGIKACNTS